MPKKSGRHYDPSARRELLERYTRSGLSRWRFSVDAGISYATLKRWLEEERQGGRGTLNLVEVRVTANGEGERRQRLRIELGNGLRVELSEPLSPCEAVEWIRELRTC